MSDYLSTINYQLSTILIDHFKGEFAALTASFLWAISSVVYTLLGQKIAPLSLNFSKGIIGIALVILTLVIIGQPIPNFPLTMVGFLALSGAIGIGLGDTAFFFALNNLGARQTLLVQTLAPPLVAIAALVFLGESLRVYAWGGILLTGLGVAWVITERTPAVVSGVHPLKGVIWASLSALAQAGGVVITRFAFLESNITPLWSTLIRLSGGVFIILFLFAIGSQSQEKTGKLSWSYRLIGAIALTAFISTYLGVWLQQTSLKFAPAGIAQTLLSTSPLFVLPLALWMGDKISLRAIFGVLIALVGVAILFSF